jgi:hypothetical protein
MTGVQDRRVYAAKSMEETLQAVKAAAESAVRTPRRTSHAARRL